MPKSIDKESPVNEAERVEVDEYRLDFTRLMLAIGPWELADTDDVFSPTESER